MASKYEVEVTITSARDLKNVNWRSGWLKPYATVWVDPANKSTTRVDDEGGTCPHWDQTFVIPFNGPIGDSYLDIDVVHAEGTEPLVGWASLALWKIVEEVGLGERISHRLELKRPSGRPQGKLKLEVTVRKTRDMYYCAPERYYMPPPQATRKYGSAERRPHSDYQQARPAYGQGSYGVEKKSSKSGMGTGLDVDALAGVLDGFAIFEGIDCVDDHIADDAADKVADDSDDDGYDSGDEDDWDNESYDDDDF